MAIQVSLPTVSESLVTDMLKQLFAVRADLIGRLMDHEAGRVVLNEEEFGVLFEDIRSVLHTLYHTEIPLEMTLLQHKIRMKIHQLAINSKEN